ncbi:MAG: class I SAM-dependent methyltransferase [Pseudomonadota bacterium]
MGYVFDFEDARNYARWVDDPGNRMTLDMEAHLVMDMLRPDPTDSVLIIGCGPGARLRPMMDAGVQLTAIDPSPYMLDLLAERYGNRVDRHRGVAESLPFEDNAFNHACLITTLEFVDDTRKAIEEACRVAKDRLFIGFLNRYAIKSVQRRLEGMFNRTIYNRARFFSVWQIKREIRAVAGNVPMSWRTVCQLPDVSTEFHFRLERWPMVQKCPFGAFAGVVAELVPRFRTRPLKLRLPAKAKRGMNTGIVPG